MNVRRGSPRKLALLALVAWTALMVAMPTASAAEGPWLDVESPHDGDLLTAKMVMVEGTASPPLRSMEIRGEELFGGELTNLEMVNGNLRFRPEEVFSDEFTSNSLNTDKWEVLLDPDNASVENGFLKLTYTYMWPAQQETLPLVKSKAFSPPEGSDLEMEYRMRFSTWGYSGAAGGISDGTTDPYESHLAAYLFWQGYPTPWFRVLANGAPVFNKSQYDIEFHKYALDFSAREGSYTCRMDGNELLVYEMEAVPTTFFFGKGESGAYPQAPSMEVDYVKAWATSGTWVSYPFELDNEMSFEGADISYTSTHPSETDMELEVRGSEDLENWTDWMPFGRDGDLETPLQSTNVQLRLRMGMPGVRVPSARIVVDRIDLRYRDPIESVEVRRQGGEWVTSDGLEDWSVELALVENENVIEVRVTDVGGSVNTTSLQVVVDTTPPVGTMAIKGEWQYTNDLNVTLELNATDRWGVEYVELSHWIDFKSHKRFPYASELEWTISDVEGLNYVYARFIDVHGLVSPPVSDTIVYDTFPPMASIIIDGGLQYTSETTVQLDLGYEDLNGILSVVISNDPGFQDLWEVPQGVTTVSNWKLAGTEDGEHTVHMRVVDMAGNIREASDTIELYIPKPLGSLSINGGDELTGQTVVELNIEVPYEDWVRLMQFSNVPTFKGAEWVSLSESFMWILEPGDGIRTVYMRFIDTRDIVSVPVNDTIRLDTSPPTVEVTLDDGAKYTTDTVVKVQVGYEDPSDPVRMWLARDDSFDRLKPQDFEPELNWTVPARESDHMVYVQVEDAAGNLGHGFAVIHYATISPTIQLSLPEGDVTSTTDSIPVNITPTDPYGGIEVQVVFDGHPDDEDPWIPLTGLVHVPVRYGTPDGTYDIRARARNAAGLVSREATIKVVLDTLAPILTIIFPEDGSVIPQKDLDVRLQIEASDRTRILSIIFVVDGGEELEIPTDVLAANITLDGFGDHTIEVRAKDEAGNIARGTSTFTLEDSEALASGVRVLPLLLLVLLAGVGAAAYGLHRTWTPGLRNVAIEEGDGWDEEFTHPTLVGEEEATEAGLEKVEVTTTETPVEDVGPPDDDTLEEVGLPSDLEAEAIEEPPPNPGWEEI